MITITILVRLTDGRIMTNNIINATAKLTAKAKLTADKIKDKIDDSSINRITYSLNSKINKIRMASQRAVKGYDEQQVYDFGDSELKLIASKLHKFALETIGYPDGYNDYLKPHEDGWEKTIAPFKAAEAYTEEHGHIIADKDKNGKPLAIQIPTCENVGIEYSAWLEDIEYAASVIDEYIDYNYNSDRIINTIDMFGKDEYKRRADMLDKEFQRTWAWLGRHIMEIWW